MRPVTSFMLNLPVLTCCVLGALSVLSSSHEISENSKNGLITSSLIQASSTGATGSSDASRIPLLHHSSRSLLQLRHCAAQACPPYLCCSSSFGCGLGSACLTDCLSGPCETAGNTVTSNSVTGNSAAGTRNTVDGATADGSTTGGGGNPRGPRLQPPVCCTAAACDLAPIIVFSSLFLLLAVLLCLRHQQKQREKREQEEEERQGGSNTRERGRPWQKPSQHWWQWARNRTIHADPEAASQQHNICANRSKLLLNLPPSPSDAPRRFTFAQLTRATGGFSPENKIGEGAFGTVYRALAIPVADSLGATSGSRRGREAAASGKGVDGGGQRNEELWAVKRAKRGSMGPGGAFEREVRTIWRLNHCSLVSLIGWCAEQREQLLVYEFVPNGNLYEALHGACGVGSYWLGDLSLPPLSFPQRIHIALGVARALHYIHEQARDRMLHRDVKSLNILLTAELQPKLSDFGLSRMLEGGEASFFTHGLSGTRGYLDPEFITTHRASTKTDVYSFGVVLLELLTGQRPLLYISPTALAAMPQPPHTSVVSEIVLDGDQISQIPVDAHAGAASTKLLLEDPSLGASSNHSFGVTTLADWARRMLSHGHLADILDPRMPCQLPDCPPQLAEFADVAVSCTDPIGYRRPGPTAQNIRLVRAPAAVKATAVVVLLL
ncbi:unnamed protein product [Closterium sp. NIES-64]|nr:unnamed protein product [Closterium sp. NIES-64]